MKSTTARASAWSERRSPRREHVARGAGDVRVICPMTIGGSFDAKTTALSGAVTASGSGSAALDGSLAVDLRTLDTGISLRNEHLRENYLEVDQRAGVR